MINTDLSLEELVAQLLKRGGRVDRYYLQIANKNKHALVYLNKWFGGKNIKEALQKSLA